MTKAQKEMMKRSLRDEKRLLSYLEKIYQEAGQEIGHRIEKLMEDYESTGLQGKIYQKRYQESLKKMIDETLGRIRSGVFKSIDDYRNNCYENGFLGTMYDMQKQGVPLIMPIDPEKMYRAINLDTRLSRSLYDSLGISISDLKKVIRDEISREIAAGTMYDTVAMQINRRMGIGRNKAMRIARTEGQRITNEATYHAQLKAKENGADVVKEWCGILDGRIRPSHAELHGQIRELDEPFEVNGHSAMYPQAFGIPSEDINCRCTLLQRARWALEDEDKVQEGTIIKDLSECKSFDSFRKEYDMNLNN